MRLRRRSEAFTLIELLIVIAILAVLISLALPSLLESRKAAREGDAVSVMRWIITSQETFKAREMGGGDRYATLFELTDTPVAHQKLMFWPDNAKLGLRNQYQFTDLELPTSTTWCVVARPVTLGTSGDNYFAATEDGQIRRSLRNPASRADVMAMSPVQ